MNPDQTPSIRFETLLKSPKREIVCCIEFVEPELGNERRLEDIGALPRPKTPVWPRLEAAQ